MRRGRSPARDDAAARPLRPTGLAPLLVASGAAALAYEVLWARDWALLYGSTAVGTAVVLAVYFAGLALGAAAAVQIPDGRRGLIAYAALEAALAVSVLGYLALRPTLPAASVWLANAFPGSGLPAARAVLALVVLGLPTVLIGASLPAVAASLPPAAIEEAGRLYAWNTLGGALGALLSGLVTVRVLGVRGTFLAAVALDLTAAAGALGLARRWRDPIRNAAVAEGVAAPPHALAAIAVAAVTGFVGLAGEVLWTRGLAGVLSNSVYSVAIVLGAVLVGLVIGAARGSSLAASPAAASSRLATTLLALALAIATSLVALRPLPSLTVYLASAFGVRGAGTGLLIEALLALLVVLLPSVCLGTAFPLILSLAGAPAPGRAVSRVLAANTAAGIAGALVGAFVLLPSAGLARGLLLLATIAGATAAGIASPGRQRMLAGVVTAAGLVGMVVVPQVQLAWQERAGDERVLFYRDGATATVTVTADPAGRKRLRVNGKYSLGGTAGLLLERRAAYLPLLLHPHPERLLALGVATGDTVGAAATHPDLHIDGVEIVPEVLEAAGFFGRENNGVLSNPRVRLLVDDARSHLLATRERYDVILSDLFLPWTAGTAALYSLDFYRTGLEHLRPGGLYCQWLPLHQLGVADLEMITATFLAAFPHAQLWVAYHRTLTPLAALIGSATPIHPDAAALAAKLAQNPVAPALIANGLEAPGDVAALYVTDDRHLRTATRGIPLITDDHPRLEFTAPAAYFHQQGLSRAAVAWITARLDPNPAPFEGAALAPAALRAALLRAQLALLDDDGPTELRAYLEALTIDPTLRTTRAAITAIAQERLSAGDRQTATYIAAELRNRAPDTPETQALLRALATR